MDMTKGKEKGRSNAPPRNRHINNYVSNRTRCRSLLPYDFQLRSYLWLQRDTVDALALALVSHRSVDLSGRNVFVTQHVLNGIDACSCIYL